jgi:hypothetical protein
MYNLAVTGLPFKAVSLLSNKNDCEVHVYISSVSGIFTLYKMICRYIGTYNRTCMLACILNINNNTR